MFEGAIALHECIGLFSSAENPGRLAFEKEAFRCHRME
jgi:hypothetical protein